MAAPLRLLALGALALLLLLLHAPRALSVSAPRTPSAQPSGFVRPWGAGGAGIIRELRDGDAEVVAQHRLEVFRGIARDESSVVYRSNRDRLAGLIDGRRRQGVRVLVAHCGEEPMPLARYRGSPGTAELVGNVELSSTQFEGTMFQRRRPRKSRWYLTEMGVASAYRRNGIALALLESAELLARREGVEEIFLHVDAVNTAAVRLYEKAGFAVEPETEEVVAFTRKMGLLSGNLSATHHHFMRKGCAVEAPVLAMGDLDIGGMAEA